MKKQGGVCDRLLYMLACNTVFTYFPKLKRIGRVNYYCLLILGLGWKERCRGETSVLNI